MRIIDFKTVRSLGILPRQSIEWTEYVLKNKYQCKLPAKVSLKMEDDIFVNTMPSFLPMINRYGVKIVSRYPRRTPALMSEIMLYDASTGRALALMDGTWITTMRTGAVAALAIRSLKPTNARIYAFMGLGNTASSVLLHLAETDKSPMHIRLLAYKEQEKAFIRRFERYGHLSFEVCPDTKTLIDGADVVVSCITAASGLMAPDECFKEGVLVVPVHTRGFQNCDLFFDKVYADDKDHVKDFRYFDRFRKFDEFSQILLGNNPGRENDNERILAYNIGISLHDIYFASQVYDLAEKAAPDIIIENENRKVWI